MISQQQTIVNNKSPGLQSSARNYESPHRWNSTGSPLQRQSMDNSRGGNADLYTTTIRNSSPARPTSGPNKRVTLVVPDAHQEYRSVQSETKNSTAMRSPSQRMDLGVQPSVGPSPSQRFLDEGNSQRAGVSSEPKKSFNPDEDLFHISLRGLVGDFTYLPYSGKKSVIALPFSACPNHECAIHLYCPGPKLQPRLSSKRFEPI